MNDNRPVPANLPVTPPLTPHVRRLLDRMSTTDVVDMFAQILADRSGLPESDVEYVGRSGVDAYSYLDTDPELPQPQWMLITFADDDDRNEEL